MVSRILTVLCTFVVINMQVDPCEVWLRAELDN
jgi:hypothetical protein